MLSNNHSDAVPHAPLAEEIASCIKAGLPALKESDFPKQNNFNEAVWASARDLAELTLTSEQKRNAGGILDSVLDCIGETPMIRLDRFARAHKLPFELVGKCEFLNAGGSLKDRIGKSMVEDAERTRRIKPGSTLIEPTSGNTGVGLALSAAVKGYNMIITLPEKMSNEKVNIMKALGAEILRTPTEAAWNSPESHIGLALKLQKVLPDSHVLDQYSNFSNPLVHYHITADEILRQCENNLDMIVISAGTGGAITGIGKRIKERLPNCKIIGVDPKGSVLALPDTLNDEKRNQSYFVEGIGYDFIPTVLDRSVVDEWVKTDDADSFVLARELIRTEGLLVGGSSGSVLAGLLQAGSTLKAGQRCCVLLPDSSRNYLSKFISDSWMIENGFYKSLNTNSFAPFKGKMVANLVLHAPVTVFSNVSVSNVVKLMVAKGIDQVPVVANNGDIMGVATEGNLSSYVQSGRLTLSDPVEKGIYKRFKQVSLSSSLNEVSQMLETNAFVIVVAEQQVHDDSGTFKLKQVVVGVVTRIDLLRFLAGEMSL